MDPRAAALIERLGLRPHPEGGHFREVYRSPALVVPADGRDVRAAVTTIFFLLAAGERSRFHRVRSDEVWHFCEGDPLQLVWLARGSDEIHRVVLGRLSEQAQPVAVVPAGSWQAARTTSTYTLVSCTVGPGFEFADFQLLADAPAEASRVRQQHPDLAELL